MNNPIRDLLKIYQMKNSKSSQELQPDYIVALYIFLINFLNFTATIQILSQC